MRLNTTLPPGRKQRDDLVASCPRDSGVSRSHRSNTMNVMSTSFEVLDQSARKAALLPPVRDSTTMVELRFSVRGLNLNSIWPRLKSCFVAIYVEPPGTDRWVEVGLTESVAIPADNNNQTRITFTKKFSVQYRFQERQLLRFELYDGDGPSNKSNNLLGHVRASLGEIVYSSLFGPYERSLLRHGAAKPGDEIGVLQVAAVEATGFKENILLQFAADHLPAKVFKRHAFFFELHRVRPNGELVLVHHSQDVASRHRTAAWQAFTITMQTLCSDSPNEKLRFSLWRRRRNGVPVKLISFFNTTAATLLEGSRSLQNIYRMEKRCTVRLTHLSRSMQFSFLDHVHANAIQLHCVVAVDFTASNGTPNSPTSLHYLKPGFSNQYQTALRAVLEIMQDYDSDKLFPAFGFGAMTAQKFELSNKFNLNGHPTNPNCAGIEGVLLAYERAVRTVRMYEPSNFEPIIRHVSRMASSDFDGRNYYILLMLTDGVISDMTDTIDAIVEASSLPLSIIIVGVGSADFTAMRALDADDVTLISSYKQIMERDIVQFVPFSQIISEGDDKTAAQVQAKVASEVLRKIPDQFLSYMTKLEAFNNSLANFLSASGRTEPNCSVGSFGGHQINRSY